MIENCLRHKIIRDFLKHYTENRWKDLEPQFSDSPPPVGEYPQSTRETQCRFLFLLSNQIHPVLPAAGSAAPPCRSALLPVYLPRCTNSRYRKNI